MQVIDNVISTDFLNSLWSEVDYEHFLWCFQETTGFDREYSMLPPEDKISSYGLTHIVYDKMFGGIRSPTYNRVLLPLYIAAHSLNITINEIYKVRINCSLNVRKKIISDPHFDIYDSHKTAIFYLNDTDGETVIYNEKFDPEVWENAKAQAPEISDHVGSNYRKEILKNNLTVMQKITPVRNRMALFDGYHFHAATSPTSCSRRVVFVYNFI